MVLGDFFNNKDFTPKIGDKVWAPHGLGVIAKTELISMYENDPDAYLRYGVNLECPMDFMPYYIGKELRLFV